jgi:hypothetical protein
MNIAIPDPASDILDHLLTDVPFNELAGNRNNAVFLSFESLRGQDLLERADLTNQLKPCFFQPGFRKCREQIAVKETAGTGKVALRQPADKILCFLFQVIYSVHFYYPIYYLLTPFLVFFANPLRASVDSLAGVPV